MKAKAKAEAKQGRKRRHYIGEAESKQKEIKAFPLKMVDKDFYEMRFNFFNFLAPERKQMSFADFTKTSIWQKAQELLLKVYKLTRDFPVEEKYGLVADMRRSANSVLHNFAEGFGRFEAKDKTRFYKISRGSAYEIISQTITSFNLGYINLEDKEYLISGYKEIIEEEDSLILSIEKEEHLVLSRDFRFSTSASAFAFAYVFDLAFLRSQLQNIPQIKTMPAPGFIDILLS